jgi:competence protein ComEC
MTNLHTHILSVGRGDSIIIQLPSDDGRTVIGIIDCYIYNKTKDYLEDNGIWPDEVRFMTATHPHDDHVLGLQRLLGKFAADNIPVGLFIDSGYEFSNTNYVDLMKYLLKHSDTINTVFARSGTTFSLGKVKLRVLSPPSPLIEGTRSDCNNSSVVLSLTYGRSRLMFAADAELPNWAHICTNQRRGMRSQVLKLSHHGSKWGTFFEALDIIKPKYTVISGPDKLSEDGSFPHPLTKKALEYAKTDVYCTAGHGDIHIESKGNATHTVTTQNGGP